MIVHFHIVISIFLTITTPPSFLHIPNTQPSFNRGLQLFFVLHDGFFNDRVCHIVHNNSNLLSSLWQCILFLLLSIFIARIALGHWFDVFVIWKILCYLSCGSVTPSLSTIDWSVVLFCVVQQWIRGIVWMSYGAVGFTYVVGAASTLKVSIVSTLEGGTLFICS